MPKKTTPPSLSSLRVSRRVFFETGDKKAFRLACRLLQNSGYRVGGSSGALLKMIPNFEKAFWQPEYKEMFDQGLANSVDGYSVAHQSMHVLVARRFGSQLRGKPRLTLLSEALAGAVHLYYALQFVRNGGDLQRSRWVKGYLESAKILNRGFYRKFNSLLQDPFAAYKQNALDSFEISQTLLKTLEVASRGGEWTVKELEKKFRHIEHLEFLREKDFPNFILFTATYCGFRSIRQDNLDCENCISLLQSSPSLSELMNQLGVTDQRKIKTAVGLGPSRMT